MDRNDSYEETIDSERKAIENNNKIRDSIASVLKQQEKIQQIVDKVNLPIIDISTSAIEPVKSISENSAVMAAQENASVLNEIYKNCGDVEMLDGMETVIETLQNSNVVHALGEISIKSAFSDYQFESPALRIFEKWSENIEINLATGLTALITNPVMQEIQSITSGLGQWLQTVDFSPLINILENIQNIGFDFDYKEVNEVFLKAMFDARWFPYAGWIADFRIVGAMLEILNTSRVSQNRVNRIDRLIFSYYDKEEINNFKRRWRQKSLPSYMTRILVQSVQAYHRREYALTVSALSTLWEGIIQQKMNDNSYRISRKTRENLSKLIEENEFDKIFSSFCDEFIFYNCIKPEDVKSDVPGRHGIAHCWYDTYPNRKMALNAIIFTDFLLELKPIEKNL
ncbi:putative uncharacterized protein [Clostridium sp. CAG:127]|nr:putative uncharacterized protein [Clostridium sp. CAG:127]